MRQQEMTGDDCKFRTMLENMRWKSCTSDDVAYLRTRMIGNMSDDIDLDHPRFKNKSIITHLNAKKDQINLMGAERFAIESGQELTYFYSIDYKTEQITYKNNMPKKLRQSNIATTRKRTKVAFDEKHQQILWDLRHCATDHHPGKLGLCKGMPIMIKRNVATECGVTNGAEATVVDWKGSIIPGTNKQVLDTLFVKLSAPTRSIKLDGLPENVVPLSRTVLPVECKLDNGVKVRIKRDQVCILPNFAMTDYASQGRTRPDNPLDLSSCGSHMSYYTCLSRGSTSAGTVILSDVDASKITGGPSGELKEEFRALEVLDDITRTQYIGELPDQITGHMRNVLIRSYLNW